MHPGTRRAGSTLSIATLLPIFPANVHMAIEAEKSEQGVPGGRNALYARRVRAAVHRLGLPAGDWD